MTDSDFATLCSRLRASARCCAATRGCSPAPCRRCAGSAESGETVRVCAADGAFLAWAGYSPSSRIRARVWDFAEDTRIDDAFFLRRIEAALALRRALLPTRARRLPPGARGIGRAAGRDRRSLRRPARAAGDQRRGRAPQARDRARAGEQHRPATRCTSAAKATCCSSRASPRAAARCSAREPRARVIEERGVRYAIDVRAGHKTGFYLDQRDNRALVRGLSQGRDVLDCFCYSGGFALNAALGAARSVLRGRQLRGRARARAQQRARERPARRRGRLAARRRVRMAAPRARCAQELRSDRARSAQARADRAPRRARRARVQGREPARVQVAAPRRCAAHVLVLGGRIGATCSRRSSRRPPPTPASMLHSCAGSAPGPIIRSRWRFPKVSTSRAYSATGHDPGGPTPPFRGCVA